MDEDCISVTDGATEIDMSSYDRQLASLKTYIDSLPYECETVEQMQDVLESIVGKICIAVEAKNWNWAVSWDGMLQQWMSMRYPIATSTRAKLIRLYYEMCIIPGVETRVIRLWADTLGRLIKSPHPALRQVDPTDIVLDWKPLWAAARRELWSKLPKSNSRNPTTTLFYVVEKTRRYFAPDAIPEMLETFLPLFTQDNALTMMSVITSFLPPSKSHLYLPTLFKLWEAFNSAVFDDRMLDLCGELAEANIIGDAKAAAEWKDVGIWTKWQWDFLTSKCLSSTNIPIGGTGSGTHSTSSIADSNSKQGNKIKKKTSRISAMAKLFVYSISVDGPVRNPSDPPARQEGYPAGSRALDSLQKLVDSAENYFHPSNTGIWTPSLTALVQRLCAEFINRYNEQDTPQCNVPQERRLTPQIRRTFVTTLRTAAMLSMFSKDDTSASFAQGALRTLAMLEPKLIMPELLDRAFGGLEVVNETHRTTGVLSTLSGIARPLVTSSIWSAGQKHLVPLLELCLPGIDLNDPTKTIYASVFIVNVVQHIKIGDLSAHQGGVAFSGDSTEGMDVDEEVDQMPDDLGGPVLSREEEMSLTRDSTSGFADWVVSLFRRVFALYENLPEEGGRRNVTGGKSEESVLKAVKNMLDMVCIHLSDPMFDLVLKLVYEYASTNAKSNAVRAFGQLISALAKANPEKMVAKFLPMCAAQIEEELKHGASSVRTSSTHAAAPSDTTLHWHLAILRNCLGYGGKASVRHKPLIIRLFRMLVEFTKSERGYTSSGRLMTRTLSTMSSIYPLKGRFVNADEWDDPNFDRSHHQHWGKLYEAKDVQVDWHVPSAEEVDFVIEILEAIHNPMLDIVEKLLETTSNWDSVARNDFCRSIHAARATWIGLSSMIKLPSVESVNDLLIPEFENPEMIIRTIEVNCGFTLSDPTDPRYEKVRAYRTRFGQVVAKASSTLRQNNGGEDHADALVTVARCIDTYLSCYGVSGSDLSSASSSWRQARESNRSWLRQKTNSRLNYVQRIHVYHMSRLHMNAQYRRRTALDDEVLLELAEHSLSQYVRIRRQAQASLINSTMRFVRSTRLILPTIFKALTKGNHADRMKGALYVLANKGIAGFCVSDPIFYKPYIISILECQHEDKPSIQKLVSQVMNEGISSVQEEAVHTNRYRLATPRVDEAMANLRRDLSTHHTDQKLLREVVGKTQARGVRQEELWHETIAAILQVAQRPTTHWRYIQMSLQYLFNLLWRDMPAPPNMAKFVTSQLTNPQKTIRSYAQRGLAIMLYHVKMRTYCGEDKAGLWAEKWKSPYKVTIPVDNPADLLAMYHQGIKSGTHDFYIDRFPTGFLCWTKTIDGFKPTDDVPPAQWEASSAATLEAISSVVTEPTFVSRVGALWAQESDRNASNVDIRMENLVTLKYLGKIFGTLLVPHVLKEAETLMLDSDKFKQRAGGELVIGMIRGAKNWPKRDSDELWTWLGERLPRIYAQIKPDTLSFWERVFQAQLTQRDPRRNKVLLDWMMSNPLDFSGVSAFDMTKSLTMFGTILSTSPFMLAADAQPYINLLFENSGTDYAEIRTHICNGLYLLMKNLWQPWHPSTKAFVTACSETDDPLRIRSAIYMAHVKDLIEKFPIWREQRLPPPRVTQSQYDRIGVTVLQWIWISSYGAPAPLIMPYIAPLLPEVLRMSELSDNPDLQAYSAGVLYVPALTPLCDNVGAILNQFITSIETSTSWRVRLQGLPAIALIFFKNLFTLSQEQVDRVFRLLIDCLSHENVEVRDMASKVLSSIVRMSQRKSIIPLKNRFVTLARKTTIPARNHPEYAARLRTLHSAILGLCALIESFPYTVEPWMPPLTEVLAPHATDPPPISTTIRQCASEFKKTHQDTWHKDQYLFDEDQLQSLSTMLVGTSYYA